MSTRPTTHAWADAFGIWHVRVVEYGTGNARAAQREARRRMLEELEGRCTFAPHRLKVKRTSRVSEYGTLTSEYVETWV